MFQKNRHSGPRFAALSAVDYSSCPRVRCDSHFAWPNHLAACSCANYVYTYLVVCDHTELVTPGGIGTGAGCAGCR